MLNARASFLEKAAQCRRLAAGLANAKEPAKHALLALAQEFENEAARHSTSCPSVHLPVIATCSSAGED